ncbi:MAG: BTAD domain-containing putative transcriptional regulator [Methylophagaceae bacterium]
MVVQVATHAAKISQPKLSGIFPRTHLFNQLNAHQQQLAVWLSGPPGSGKTSLVSSYFDTQDTKMVWYQMDEGDADLATFFSYLGQSIKKSTPRKRGHIPVVTPEFEQKTTAFSRHFFRTVFALFSDNFVFVFDNYQDVGEQTELHQLLVIALEELPENGSIIFISRSHPPAEYSRLRANKQLSILDWEHLKLSQQEMSDIFELRGLPQENIPVIMEATQGWIAGLTLLAAQEGEALFLEEHLSEFNPELLFDYFVSEVFDRADEQTKRLLLKTAWLPRMTIEMASQLSGIKSAATILDSLVNKNFFTYRHASKKAIYEYHPLFREFLLAKSTQILGDIELNVSKWNAAELLENNQQIEAAIELYSQLEDWLKVATIIKNVASNLINQGRVFILQEWISKIPEQQLNNDPWLLYWLALATKTISPPTSQHLFKQAYKEFKQQNTVDGLFLSLSGLTDSIRMDHSGNAQSLNLCFTELEQLIKLYPNFPSPEIEIEVVVTMFVALWWHNPGHKDFDYWKDHALLTTSKLSNDNRQKIRVHNVLLLHLIFSGEMIKASYLLDEMAELEDDNNTPPELLIFHQIAKTLLAWRSGDLEQAYSHLENALEVGKKTGFHNEDSQLMAIGASIALTQENKLLAKQFIEKHEAISQGSTGSRYHYIKAWHALFEGKLEVALTHAEQSVDLAEKMARVPYFTSLSYHLLSIIQLNKFQHTKSTQSLKQGQRIAEQIGSKLLLYQSRMIEAKLLFETGKRTKGLKALEKALGIGGEQSYIGIAGLTHQDISQLCVEALKENIEVDYTKIIIRKMGLEPSVDILETNNWPWPIKIFCLSNGFDIKSNDQPIATSRKTQKKPLAVIKVLIAYGAEKVPETKVIEALWPDSDGDTGHQSLATTLHRLRKLLGDDVIELRDGLLSLNKQKVWVDTWAFDKLVSNKNADINTLQQAIEIYKAQLLAEDKDAWWSVPAREKLHHQFIDVIERIGQSFEESDDWQQACEYYRKGLEIDATAELLYQRLMHCYINMDREGDAVKTYRQCFRVLNSHLGIEPSIKTKKLYSQLQT